MRPALLLLVCVLSALLPQGALAQAFPIGAFYTSEPLTVSNDLDHLDNLDSLYYNNWSVVHWQDRAVWEDSAAVYGVGLWSHQARPGATSGLSLDRFTRVWRYFYHPEDGDVNCLPGETGGLDNRCDNARVGSLVTDTGASLPAPLLVSGSSPGGNAIYGAYGTPGHLIYSKKSEQHLFPCCDGDINNDSSYLTHRFRYRVRVTYNSTPPPSGTVLLTVNVGQGSTTRVDTIRVSNVPGSSYFERSFTIPFYTMDFLRVVMTTTGAANVWVDWYGLESQEAEDFFSGDYDDDIEALLGEFTDPVYTRHYVNDEPFVMQGRALHRVDSLARATTGTPTISAINAGWFTTPVYLERLIQQWEPETFLVDSYRFGINSTPDYPAGGWGIGAYSAGSYNATLQGQLDLLAHDMQVARDVGQAYDTEFLFTPQTLAHFDENVASYIELRPPSAAETKVQVWMGLAYGTKGIIYFLQKTLTNDFHVGLVNRDYEHNTNDDTYLALASNTFVPVYTGYADRWAAVRRTDSLLTILAPTLLQLTSVHTYSTSETTPSGSYVVNVTEVSPPIERGRRDVHVGTFTHGSSPDDYFMLVNRLCRPGDTRTLTVQIESAGANARYVYDVATGGVVASLAAWQSSFNVTLVPGEGRLFRVALAIDDDRTTGTSGGQAAPVFALEEARPNPARATAAIAFSLPTEGHARLVVYDALGREVAVLADGELDAGRHEVRLDTGALPAGVYVYRLTTGDREATRRVVVVR